MEKIEAEILLLKEKQTSLERLVKLGNNKVT